MSFWSRSVHMLWALLKSSFGRANFFVTFQLAASTAVAVPGFVLWAVFSYSVSTQTSPTPFAVGAVAFGSVTGSWKYLARNSSRLGMITGFPFPSWARTGTAGYTGSQVVACWALWTW